MDLCDYNNINKVLSKYGFTFSKALGQNFITDGSVCPKMAQSLEADEHTGVLEIGPGIGVLTKELSAACGKTVCVELDKRLLPVLDETLSGCDNVEVVNDDIMELDLQGFIKDKFDGMTSVKVCANLPYYITSPVIMRLLESRLNIDSIVVMVQKEAAQRLCAHVGSRSSGAVTAAVDYYAKSEILFDVSRESFMPIPKVDSAVVKFVLRSEPPVKVHDEKKFFYLIKAAFCQRRKTFINSVCNCAGISKGALADALNSLDIDLNIRAERLTMQQLADISNIIF